MASAVAPADDNVKKVMPAENGGDGQAENPAAAAAANEDENPERGNWTGKLDFLLSCLGYAVGLGNVWRFPYLCFKHGGGAFLIPYAIMLLFIGIPCFLLELTLGQYSGLGPVTAYSNLAPLFKGLGFANFFASCFVGLYYNMIIAWSIYYLFASFTSQLPWDNCANDFNSEFCFNINDFNNCTEWRRSNSSLEIIYHKGKCLHESADLEEVRSNLTHFYGCTYKVPVYNDPSDVCKGVHNYTESEGIFISESECVDIGRLSELEDSGKLFDIPFKIRQTAAQEYLERSVLDKSSGIDDMGPVKWHLCLCLLAAWIVIFCCLIKGIKSSGKVVYFTATFPYVMLVILLIRAALLDGAYDGIQFYMQPDWSKLSDIDVWEAAAVQIFFSLSVAGGGLVTLASYNKFHNNVVRDTFIVCFGNCLTSVFAGFAIFSILGFLAKEMGVPVSEVVQGGSGLAFIAYPDLVTRLPISPLWSILFFSMLFTLGLDSQFAIVETILSGILDFAPKYRGKKTIVVGILCTVGFIIGLPLTTGGGSYLLDLLDYYAAGWPYLFIGLTELFIFGYIYGIENYFADLKHIMNFNPGLWLKSHLIFLYMTLSPFLILVILIFSWSSYKPYESGGYTYPPYANAIGWCISMIAILAVPIVAIVQIVQKIFVEYNDESSFSKKWSKAMDDLLNPTPEWRKTAERAKRRDNQELNENGGENGAGGGFYNVGMTPIADEGGKVASSHL